MQWTLLLHSFTSSYLQLTPHGSYACYISVSVVGSNCSQNFIFPCALMIFTISCHTGLSIRSRQHSISQYSHFILSHAYVNNKKQNCFIHYQYHLITLCCFSDHIFIQRIGVGIRFHCGCVWLSSNSTSVASCFNIDDFNQRWYLDMDM